MNSRNAILFCSLLFAVASSAVVNAEEFDSAGVKIHYEIKGAGEPVILIHGLYASAKLNWDLPGVTKELAKQYRVIALDNRGHGESGRPAADSEYGEKMAGDIIRLMDHLHLTNARVVGYSLGGMIAMKLVVQHPERVRSVVLGGMGWFRADMPGLHYWEKARDEDNMFVPAACLRAMSKLGVTAAEVKAVRVPVVMIVGDQDPLLQACVAPMHKLRPDWPEHIIKGAGHMDCVFKADFKEQLKAALEERKD